MKTKYLLLGILLCVSSCGLFKKTSKTTAINSASSMKQAELNEFLLKQADKETQIITYWNDSGFYQIQNIKERVDEAKSKQVTTKETENSKEKLVTKESKSLQIWWWVGIVGLIVCGFFFVRARR
jgi:hypothetical protein